MLIKDQIRFIWGTHRAFLVLAAGYAVVVFTTFTDYGITNDEPLHLLHGEALMDWYLGRDDRVLEMYRVYYYGAFFDIVAHLASFISPYNPLDTKHLCNGLVGLLGIVAAYRIGYLLGGVRGGMLAAIALALTPRYYGHSFNNPKDIPFAVFYLWSVYYLLRCLDIFPRISRRLSILTGLAIGLTLAIRVGGLVVYMYAGLFLLLALILVERREPIDWPALGIRIATTVVVSLTVMYAFWPRASVMPLQTPYEALTKFSDFPDTHWSFFDGTYVGSPLTPRVYIPRWVSITLPEFVYLGLLAAIALISIGAWRRWRSITALQYGILALAGVFPIAYAYVMKPHLYDGMRHFLFTVPPLSVLGGTALAVLCGRRERYWKISSAVVGVAFGGLVLGEMIRLHPYQSSYFNHIIAGTIDTAWHRYETDYWRHGQKEAVRWIAENCLDEFDRPIRVSSRFVGTEMQMPEGIILLDYRSDPDFYIGSTRFDEHRVIPGEVVQIVKAGSEAELVYVVRPNNRYQYDAFFTDSFFADLHRRKIYRREAEYRESRDETVRAAQAYLMLARVYERLRHFSDRLEFSKSGIDNLALNNEIKAIRLISKEDALTVAFRHISQGFTLPAQDIYRGLVSVYPDNALYREQLIRLFIRNGYPERATSHLESWPVDGSRSTRLLMRILVTHAEGQSTEALLDELASLAPDSPHLEEARKIIANESEALQ